MRRMSFTPWRPTSRVESAGIFSYITNTYFYFRFKMFVKAKNGIGQGKCLRFHVGRVAQQREHN
jgi:hypothetical protein